MRRPAVYGIAVIAIVAITLTTGIDGTASSAVPRARTAALPSVVSAVRAARDGESIPPHLTPPLATIKLFPPRYRISRACLPHRDTTVAPILHCRVGDAKSRKLIVLFGDSHAYMWLPAILIMAKRDHWAVVPVMRFGCTPEKWFTHMGPGGPICRTWLHWAIGEIRRLHPTVTLIGGSVGETPSAQTSAAAAGVITAVRTLEPLSPLVVIGDPEGLSLNSVDCISASHALASCMTTWPPSALAAYDEVSRGARSLGVGFLPTRGFVCWQRQCPAVVGHTIVWMDTNHLTGIYSAELAPQFRAAFLRVKP